MNLSEFGDDLTDEPSTGTVGGVLTLEDILAMQAAGADPDEVAPPPAPRTYKPKPAAKLTAKSLIEQAKDRLVELKAELEAAAALQVEHDALERLVAAAES